MKNIIIVLLLCVFSMSVSAQKRTTTRTQTKQPTTLVTKAMADKIAEPCLNRVGYCPTVFLESFFQYQTSCKERLIQYLGHCINILSIRRTLFMASIRYGDMMG